MTFSNNNNFFETIFDDKSNKFVMRCLLCNKNCDTKIQLDIHNESKAHLKKLQSKATENCNSFPTNISSIRNYNFSNNVNESLHFCKICNISCNTKQQLEIHNTGKDHNKKSLAYTYRDFNSQDSSNVKGIFQPEIRLENEKLKISNETRHETPKAIQNELMLTNETVVPKEVMDLLTPKRKPNWITCQLCNLDTNTEEQYQLHCHSIKHMKKLKSLNIPPDFLSIKKVENNDFVTCKICDIQIHKNNEETHNNGKLHKEKLIKCTTSDSTEKMIHKNNFSSQSSKLELLKLKPRNYQQEIYEKSILTDCVIFLPTGTGKTLIGAMLILKMLEENPYHRVAFLVDKVLLVMQQNEFLKEQFENIDLNRFKSKSETEVRKLRIIGLAGEYINTEYNCAVRDHDVVVATADLFQNCLKRKRFYWTDFSLVILDEAHHCVKEHPYNRLLFNYHLYPNHILVENSQISSNEYQAAPAVNERLLNEWKLRRCKIIGLTASPAGDINAESTLSLLRTLLQSLGDVEIISVTENAAELKEFTSMTETESVILEYDEKEDELRNLVSQSFVFLLKKYERVVQGIANNIVYNENKLSIKSVDYFKNQICAFSKDIEATHKTVLNHMLSMVEIIEAIDSIGYKAGYKKFKDLVENRNDLVWFNNNVFCFEEKSRDIINDESEKEIKSSCIVKWIKDKCDSVSSPNRTILILVKERKLACEFTDILKEECSSYDIEMLIGHGTKGSASSKMGMSVSKQKKALDFIRERKKQIIVATSVADEGIDLPQCDLVILVTPPNSVQALIQIRGRARKKHSQLIILCRDQQSIDSLEELKTKENNIDLAINKYKHEKENSEH